MHELTNTVNELQSQIETYRGSGARESSATSSEGAAKSADVEPQWRSVAPAEPAVLAENNDEEELAAVLTDDGDEATALSAAPRSATPLPPPLDLEASSDLQAAAERMSRRSGLHKR